MNILLVHNKCMNVFMRVSDFTQMIFFCLSANLFAEHSFVIAVLYQYFNARDIYAFSLFMRTQCRRNKVNTILQYVTFHKSMNHDKNIFSLINIVQHAATMVSYVLPCCLLIGLLSVEMALFSMQIFTYLLSPFTSLKTN